MKITLNVLRCFVPIAASLIAACDEKQQEEPCELHAVSGFWIDKTHDIVMRRDGERSRFWEKNGDFYVSECEFLASSDDRRSLENKSGDIFFEILHEDSDAIYLKNGEDVHVFRPVDCKNADENLIKVIIAIKAPQNL